MTEAPTLDASGLDMTRTLLKSLVVTQQISAAGAVNVMPPGAYSVSVFGVVAFSRASLSRNSSMSGVSATTG